jgi:polyhydroxyalkanoate synthase subunit PhaC
MDSNNDASAELQREIRASLAAVTGGIAPDDYVNAWWDWYLHLAAEPQQQASMTKSAADSALDMWNFALKAATGESLPPAPTDKRFSGEAWNQWPYNVFAHTYSNWSGWWQQAISSVPSVAPKNAALMEFMGKQIMEAASPANHLPTNPELVELTRAESGANLVRGFQHWLEDAQHAVNPDEAPAKPKKFAVGRDIGVTPGKVVLRNELIELIQYSPTTKSVYAEPILITPAWIMKYYILDLSPANSLVRYLVEKGHTVFMISWKNPTQTDRNLGMDDYLKSGVLDALDAVSAIVPRRKVHAVGYCIGGTLLTIASAVLAKRGDRRLASLTLLAAQADFSEPGELSLFISPSQLAMLEAVMNKAGVLSSDQMAGSFALLRSRDLLWTPAVNNYVKGKRDDPNDLMAWNADGTRMPWRMHTEYLQKLYLQNELARGEFTADGKRVDLKALQLPLFVVGTETDHVAPWKSVYKLRGLTRSKDYTFLLTSGGHNAGIVSGPENPKRRHRVLGSSKAAMTPDAWQEKAVMHAGSWWPTWADWLAERSTRKRVAPPKMGNAAKGYQPLEAAPGSYVMQK